VRHEAARTAHVAVAAARCGSAVIGSTLAAAAADALAAPGRSVALQVSNNLGGGSGGALRLAAAVHHVGCGVLAAAPTALLVAASPTGADAAEALGEAAVSLAAAADVVVAGGVLPDALGGIPLGVTAAGGGAGGLGTVGTLAGVARAVGLRSALTARRSPVGASAGLVPPPTVRVLAAALGAAYLDAHVDATRACRGPMRGGDGQRAPHESTGGEERCTGKRHTPPKAQRTGRTSGFGTAASPPFGQGARRQPPPPSPYCVLWVWRGAARVTTSGCMSMGDCTSAWGRADHTHEPRRASQPAGERLAGSVGGAAAFADGEEHRVGW